MHSKFLVRSLYVILSALYSISIFAQDQMDTTNESEIIAFTSWRDGNAEIYTIKSDGSELTRLTFAEGDDYTPAWSPDGEYIAFTSMRDGVIEGSQEIYVMRSDGTDLTNISNSDNYDAYPQWSPDGQQIIFVSFRDANTEIYIMSSTGDNQLNLTNNDAEDMCASWSPDGQYIAFSSNRDGDFDIYVMNVDGSEVRQVTNYGTEDYCPVWLPTEHDKIVYGAYWNDRYRMYKVSTNGSNHRPFAPFRIGEVSPSWSSDSERVVFVSSRDGNSNLYMLDQDGEKIQLTHDGERDRMPSWQP